ncbi:MAG: metallophosphoesterase [Thermoplasmatales archaeon]
MTKLAIVHLSDFHIRRSQNYTQGSILNSLIPTIQDDLNNLRPDMIFVAISGDLTYQGNLEEFNLVKMFIAEIKKKITPKGIVLSPGNHDLNWDDQKEMLSNRELMRRLINGDVQSIHDIEERFSNERGREELIAGMKNYYKFLGTPEISQPYDSKYFFSLITAEVENFKINFISLNSAYLFSSDLPSHAYFGYIGMNQIDNAFAKARENLKQNFRQFNVAIFHHPFEAIPEIVATSTENKIKHYSNIILTGHTHNPRVLNDLTTVSYNPAFGPHFRTMPTILSSARCVIDEHEGITPVPGYSILEIEFLRDYVASIYILEKKLGSDGNWINVQDVENPVRAYDPPGAQPNILNLWSQIYTASTEITKIRAHSNLIVFQKTPTLILNPHPYGESVQTQENKEEIEFKNALEEKIKQCMGDGRMSLLYLFSLKDTKDVLKKYPNLKNLACENIKRLKTIEHESNRRFILAPISLVSSGPFIIADNGLLVYIGKNRDQIFVLKSDSLPRSATIFPLLRAMLIRGEYNFDELAKALGLNCKNL